METTSRDANNFRRCKQLKRDAYNFTRCNQLKRDANNFMCDATNYTFDATTYATSTYDTNNNSISKIQTTTLSMMQQL